MYLKGFAQKLELQEYILKKFRKKKKVNSNYIKVRLIHLNICLFCQRDLYQEIPDHLACLGISPLITTFNQETR